MGPGGPLSGAGGEVIRAAGCVLWRHAIVAGHESGGIEICLVHRPRYDDWSHPKGKLKRSEDPLAGALREVLEETGHHCTPGPRLPTIHYLVNGRPKEVSYWAAEAHTPGHFVPDKEVDRIVWLPPDAAHARLTQPRDRRLLDALISVRGISGPFGRHP
ncbi:NUDIX hydrolase [Streptomyces sp. SCSIO 30461]|uniref:NUDIX hydrolase n=1 Tax=Streptomyces sp. SCSIO 30461 TaxID=3118085 RepID=UPI00387E983F